MSHFYFVVRSIQQEPLLVEWLRFYLSDSGEILAADIIQCDENNKPTIKSIDATIELANPIVVYDSTLLSDPNDPSPHKNKKACLHGQVINQIIDGQEQSQLKLLRFTGSARYNIFNTGDFFSISESSKEWKKGFQKDRHTQKTTHYKVPIKLKPSEYTHLDCIEAIIQTINAQYELLQEQFTQEVQAVILNEILPSPVEVVNTISHTEEVIQFSQALTRAISEETQENLLPFLANIMDGTTSPVSFSATILTLLTRDVTCSSIINSSFPARFLIYNVENKMTVIRAYQLLRKMAEIEDEEVINAVVKENIGLFCEMADNYSISFSKVDAEGYIIRDEHNNAVQSKRGFENIVLSGAVAQQEIDDQKRINSDEKPSFSLTATEKNFQQLYAFFKKNLFQVLFNGEDEQWREWKAFVLYSINNLNNKSIIKWYDAIVSTSNETEKTKSLERICQCLSDEKALELLEDKPHALCWYILHDKNYLKFQMSNVALNALKNSINQTLTLDNIVFVVGDFLRDDQPITEPEKMMLSAVLSLSFQQTQLKEKNIQHKMSMIRHHIQYHDAAMKWIDTKEQVLISHLKTLIDAFVSNPERENYIAIDSVYQTSFTQYKILKFFRWNEKTLCPTSKDELHALIIGTLFEQKDKPLLLKQCVDAIFSDFDSFYLEKEHQVNARKSMFSLYFKNYHAFNDYWWLAQLETIFEPQVLWQFLHDAKDKLDQSLLSVAINDDEFLLRFFEKIEKDEIVVLAPISDDDFFEKTWDEKLFDRFSIKAIEFIVSMLKQRASSWSIGLLKVWKVKFKMKIDAIDMKKTRLLLKNENTDSMDKILLVLQATLSVLKDKIIGKPVASLLSLWHLESSRPSSASFLHEDAAQDLDRPLISDPRIDVVHASVPFVTSDEKDIILQLFVLIPTIEDCGVILKSLCKDKQEVSLLLFFELIQKTWLNGVLIYPKNLMELGKLLSYLDNENIRRVISNTSKNFWESVNIAVNFTDLIEPLSHSSKVAVLDQFRINTVFSEGIYTLILLFEANRSGIWINRRGSNVGDTMYVLYGSMDHAERILGVSKFLRLFTPDEIKYVYPSYLNKIKENKIVQGNFEWLEVLPFLNIPQTCALLQTLLPQNNYLQHSVFGLFNDIQCDRAWSETSSTIRAITSCFRSSGYWHNQIKVFFKNILPLFSAERQKALMDSISKEIWADILATSGSEGNYLNIGIGYFLQEIQSLTPDLFEPLWDKVCDHIMSLCTGPHWNNLVIQMPEKQKTYIIDSAMRHFQQELIDSKLPTFEKRYPQYAQVLSDSSLDVNEVSRIYWVVIKILQKYQQPSTFLEDMRRIWVQKPNSTINALIKKILPEIKVDILDSAQLQKTQFNVIGILLSLQEQGGNRNNNKLYRRLLYALDKLENVAPRVATTLETAENDVASSAYTLRT